HRGETLRLWQREVRSNWFWGLWLPLLALLAAIPTFGLSLLLLLGYPVLGVKIYRHRRRAGDPPPAARPYAFFCVLSKFANVEGQLRYHYHRLLARQSRLIEYKTMPQTNANGKIAYLVNQYPHVSHS